MSGYAYGSRNYGEGFYGGREITAKFAPVGSVVEVYTRSLTLKAIYQTGVGDFLGLHFVIDESGGRNFTLFFATYASINKRDIVKIRLMDSDDYFFTGVIRNIPLDGSTEQSYIYGGYGFTDYLHRINTESQNYTSTTVRTVVLHILDNLIVPKTPISKNLGKISQLNIAISDVSFNYIQVSNALEEIKKLANSDGNDYLVGVDADGDFFFLARSSEVVNTLVVGKDGINTIPEYSPTEIVEAKSKLYVLRNDGTLYGTETSTEDIDVFEEKVAAPDFSDSDIGLWAQGQLLIKEQETRQASVLWEIETSNPLRLIADGFLRIISNIPSTVGSISTGTAFGVGAFGAGSFGDFSYSGKDVDDTLKIKEISYTINDREAIRQIQLGALPVEIDRQIVDVNKKVDKLSTVLGV